MPRLVQTGTGPQHYQRIFLEVENVGPAIAHIGATTVDGYDPASSGTFDRRLQLRQPAPALSS
jgi:hypothetical protein